jgi:hypothetical protein
LSALGLERPKGDVRVESVRLPTAHGLKKGGMRRLAEHGNTTHELMAISGHRTLSEVQRYTEDADRKRLADSGMAKRRDQRENTGVANLTPRGGKPASKSLR